LGASGSLFSLRKGHPCSAAGFLWMWGHQLENGPAGAVRFLKPWLSVRGCSKGSRLPSSRRVKSGVRVTAQLASAGRALRARGSLFCSFPLCSSCCSVAAAQVLLSRRCCALEGLWCGLQRREERKPVLAV